ncbi:MAG: integrase [Betaproteobacteria bacterium]
MTSMGRPKTKNRDLPPRMSARDSGGRTLYYYRGAGAKIPLGDDLAKALRQWAELEAGPLAAIDGTFKKVAERYRKDVLPTKGRKTQLEQDKQLDRLIAVFGAMPVADIRPQDVRAYLDARSAKVLANREIALLSHVYNRAREWGHTAGENPVRGVTKHKERPRKVYVTDAMFRAVYAQAAPVLQDAMDLAELLGHTQQVLIGATRVHVVDGCLEIVRGKTQKPLRFVITAELEGVIKRALGRTRKAASMHLLADDNGQALTYWRLRDLFDEARDKVRGDGTDPARVALAAWQFRDLRAKNASDSETLQEAQERLGHESSSVTRRVYRRGEKVRPLR